MNEVSIVNGQHSRGVHIGLHVEVVETYRVQSGGHC